MPIKFELGSHFEEFVRGQVAAGRFENASAVLREALHLLEGREQRLSQFDAAISQGLADVAAGRVLDGDGVFDELEARYDRMGSGRERP